MSSKSLVPIVLVLVLGCASPPQVDLILNDVHLFDGTGREPYSADIWIRDGRIVRVLPADTDLVASAERVVTKAPA